MKTNFLKSLAIALCCGLFLSCSKEESSVEKFSKSSIKVEKGRLIFENQAHFDLIFNKLMENQDLEYLRDWENQFEGFTSMRTAYENLTEADFEKIGESGSIKGYESILQIRTENGEQEAAAVTDHPVMARVFNHEGLLLIGNDAFKLQKDKLIRIDSYNEEKIRKALESPDQISDYLGIESQVVSKENKNLRAGGALDLERSCTSTYKKDKYRFKGQFILVGTTSVNPFGDWTTDFSGKFNAIIWVSQHKKKIALIWFLHNAPVLKLSGTVTYLDDNGGYYPATLSELSAIDEKEIGWAYNWGTNYRATGSVTSSGTGVDGNTYQCTETR